MFPDLTIADGGTTVELGAEPPWGVTTAVLVTLSFFAGLNDLAVCREERMGFGEEEPRGGKRVREKGPSGSGGSGGWGGGLSPDVKRRGDEAEGP